MITRGRSRDLTQLPGFAVWQDGEVVGLVTYQISKGECEITSLDSTLEGRGIGTALIDTTLSFAEEAGCSRLWLVTTNDNVHAFRFYQKRGFSIVAVHVRAIDLVTRPIKPGIPLTGHDGIPLRDEIELEIVIDQRLEMGGKAPPDFPERLARRVLYSCPWMTLYLDRVQLPDGRILPDYHTVEFLDAVGVLVENGRGEFLFEQVYRYPTGRLEWEIPAGALDPGEDPVQAAKREVFEETGYETSNHRLLYTFYPNDGNTNQRFFLVHCKADSRTGEVDRGEIKDCKWMDAVEIGAMIRDGALMDGLSLVGFLLAAK